MKKIITIIFCLTALSVLNACKKLDLAPEDYFGSGNFWKNAAQVDGAMTGLHSQLRSNQFTFFTLGELRGGTFKDATGATGTSSLNSASVIRQDVRESSPGITNWAGMYGPIFQINNFIYQVNNTSFLSEADKNYYLGQAHGLRAYYYFHLYRTYGRLPLATEPKVLTNTPATSADAYLARTKTEKETLDFIKSDVDKSVTMFGSNLTTKGQGSQWSLAASQMLKAEVYLWLAKVKTDGQQPTSVAQDLATARAAVESVIPNYTLQANFADVFKYANKGNKEIIMSLRYSLGEATNNYAQFVYAITDPMTSFVGADGKALTGDPLQVAGSGSIIRYEYKYDVFAKYGNDDTRGRATFFDFYKAPVATNQFVVLRKFLGTISDNARNFSDDIPVYRLAEAYLILAEIKNKQGEDPSTEINNLRRRAYGTAPFPAFVSGSFEQNELAIFEERGKELVAEGKRWYDLRRMQDASGEPLAFRKDLPLVGVLDRSESHKLLWPIDRSTLNADELLKNDQNPGYSGT